ncbi:MAG: hypothetical protein R3D25_18865 [Geminicoccaceae bacterium]
MSPFAMSILAIVLLSVLGLPIGHAMIGGSILYLLLAGQDMGTAAEQILNGSTRATSCSRCPSSSSPPS